MSGHIDLFLLGCGFDKLKWTCLLEVWASRRAFTFNISGYIIISERYSGNCYFIVEMTFLQHVLLLKL